MVPPAKRQVFVKYFVLTILAVAFIEGNASDPASNRVVSARIESCKGCQLNRLPEVKKFIFQDVPSYEDVVFKPIQGAPPELILLNSIGEEVERISLAPLSRDECNKLLAEKGFSRGNADTPDNQRTDF